MHLTELFTFSFRSRADRVGLEYATGDGSIASLTFGELDARASRMAHELTVRGLEKGDRLCIHLPNSVEFIDIFLACTRLGIVLVPINVLYRERELRHIIADSEPKGVIVRRDSDAVYPSDAPIWYLDDVADGAGMRAATHPDVSIDGDDPALIIYTSGTTGTAKGAVLTHNNLASNGITLATVWRFSEADRYVAMLPLFHVHGLGNGLHCWLISGCRMRLLERFDHHTTPALLAEFKPTVVFGVPTIYVRLLDERCVSDAQAAAIASDARLFVSGSAPLPAHVHEAFRARFGHTIVERYGMSEALMIVSNPYDGERRAGSVGTPLPGVSARLVGEDGSVLGVDEVGEVEIRSPHLFSGYWRRPDATAAAFHDGWFRTGDLGTRTADGYYTLRGRKGDLIISGGFNIYPREIEELLVEDPRVREATVVGMPDDVRGEVPIAYVCADDTLDLTELERLCRTQLASFKVPRRFVRLETLPRTALGKVQKHLLPRTSS
ncbi:MAG TPA: AMP-binding protein [Gemmatimonadaceae bacterium]|nr:AMP-binding protein [Gemmatimonadaceae bacterium]